MAGPQVLSLGPSYSLLGDLTPPQSTKMVPLQTIPIFGRQPGPVFSPLLIATGEAIPLRGLEGVPGLPGAPQDDVA